MNDNILMMMCYIPAPLIFIIAGLMLWRSPTPYGDAIGYKTRLSCSSQEAWDFAQVYFGKLCTLVNVPVLALSADVGAFQIAANAGKDLGLLLCIIVVTVQVVFMLVCIFLTERKLKQLFGGNDK